MPNGMGLAGNASSTQSGVIVPHPGLPDRYYVFTVDHIGSSNGFRYSEVDMSLNGGLGDVIPTTKNTLLFNNQAEKIAAVRQTTQNGYWLIGHTLGNNDFYVFSITTAGIDPTPIIQSVGSTHPPFNGALGYLKASPRGTRLACAIADSQI